MQDSFHARSNLKCWPKFQVYKNGILTNFALILTAVSLLGLVVLAVLYRDNDAAEEELNLQQPQRTLGEAADELCPGSPFLEDMNSRSRNPRVAYFEDDINFF